MSYSRIKTDLLDEMVEQLKLSSGRFHEYANFHAAKMSAEDNSKAAMNRAAREEIDQLLTRVYSLRHAPYRGMIEQAHDLCLARGQLPVAFIFSRSFGRAFYMEMIRTERYQYHGIVPSFEDFMNSRYLGCRLYTAEDKGVDGVLALLEGSEVLQRARRLYGHD